MAEYILSCCSTADLTKEYFDGRNINYLCFHYNLDGVDYPDDLGQTIPLSEFYKKLSEGSQSTTSQINMNEYAGYFRKFLSEGKDVLHVCLSSGISGSINSANAAAAILREEFPDRKLYIVDSLGASSGYGLIMDTLADKRDAGADIDELYEWIEENKLRLHHWFFSTDLTFFVKGGRISKAAGVFGGIFKICPLMNMDNLGRLIPRIKVRGKENVFKEILTKMIENADDGTDYSGKCFMCQSACYDDAKRVADSVEAAFPKLNGKVMINDIGTVIGSHTGPGTVALFFWGKKREN